MTILEAVIFGIIEGITEFLPISSTGHLILAAHFLGIAQTEFVKTFEIAIQLGAIASVLFLYWRALMARKELITKLIVAFIPTAVLGAFFYPLIKNVLLGNTAVVIWSLGIGGIIIIVFERWREKTARQTKEMYELTFFESALIGALQAVAFIPGVSRALATIMGGLLVGLNKKAAVEFSFLLALPTMLGATGFDMIQNQAVFSASNLLILGIGFISAFIVALLAIRFLLRFIEQHSFIPFGIYRIAVSALFFGILVFT